MACLGELVNKYFPWEFKISMQVYVMWLPLILNTALPLALLLTLNSFIYARLATVRQIQIHKYTNTKIHKYKYTNIQTYKYTNTAPPHAQLIHICKAHHGETNTNTNRQAHKYTNTAPPQSKALNQLQHHQLRSRMRRSQEGTLRRRERRMAR